jgi:hypothetical protein
MNKHKRCFTPCPWSETRGEIRPATKWPNRLVFFEEFTMFWLVVVSVLCHVVCVGGTWGACLDGWMRCLSWEQWAQKQGKNQLIMFVCLLKNSRIGWLFFHFDCVTSNLAKIPERQAFIYCQSTFSLPSPDSFFFIL